MSISLVQLPRDILFLILKEIPVIDREKLTEVCKLFKIIIVSPYFEKERNPAIKLSKEKITFIKNYPKELVLALGGQEKFFALPRISGAQPNHNDAKTLYKPSLGNDGSYLVFSLYGKIFGSLSTSCSTKIYKDNSTQEWSIEVLGSNSQILDEKSINSITKIFKQRWINSKDIPYDSDPYNYQLHLYNP
jgi:hypothetical protein